MPNAGLRDLVDAAKTAVASNDRVTAVQLVTEFRNYSTRQLDLDQLITSADLHFTAEIPDLAHKQYVEAHKAAPNFYWPIFQVGRLKLQSREFDTAATFLEQATLLEPKFAWTWYELCRCLHELRQTARLALAAQGFSRADKVALSPEHMETLAIIAHYLFEQKLRQEPFEIYTVLIEAGFEDDLVSTRHAEYFIWKSEYNQVVKLLEPRLEAQTLGPWGKRALASAYEELGQSDRACDLLAELVRQKPRVYHFLRDAIRSFARSGNSARASETFSYTRHNYTPEQQTALEVVLLAETRQFSRLLEFIRLIPATTAPEVRDALDYGIVESAYRENDYDIANALISVRKQLFGMDERTTICAINIAFAQRKWNESAALLASVRPELLSKSVELRVKRFEHLCFINDLDGARSALKELGPLSELATYHLLPVAKYYAEVGDWSSVVKIFLNKLDKEFRFDESASLLVRAVRKTNSHSLALIKVDNVLNEGSASALERLRAVLLEDLADTSVRIEGLCLDERSQNIEVVRQRLAIKRLVCRLEQVPAKPAKYAIYYCTNSAYLGPSLVSIVSLVNSNRDLLEDCDIFLVTESAEQKEVARTAASQIAEKNFLRPIVVKARDDFVGSKTTFKHSYGLFTGGHTLAEAAYYRIYFADYLNSLEIYERALYIDSDTVVHGDLSSLFRDVQSLPLMARLEVDRPEIAEAIRLHKFEKGRYFNSGVLLFDLKDLRLTLGLRRSMHVIEHSLESLIFQDQCALNLGFQNLFGEMDPQFNWFITPHQNDPTANGSILHFLDRPKPWDPLYNGRLGRLWFLNWHRLATLVGQSSALDLHARALVQ